MLVRLFGSCVWKVGGWVWVESRESGGCEDARGLCSLGACVMACLVVGGFGGWVARGSSSLGVCVIRGLWAWTSALVRCVRIAMLMWDRQQVELFEGEGLSAFIAVPIGGPEAELDKPLDEENGEDDINGEHHDCGLP